MSNATEFIFSAGGFESEQEALELGQSLKNCLLVLGAKWRLGIDVGHDIASGTWADSLKQMMAEKFNLRLVDNVHGLCVIPDDLPSTAMTISASGVVDPKTSQDFGEEILSLLNQSPNLNQKDRLAFELYGSSHYEKSMRSKFLTLVLSIESLLELKDRQDDVQKLVDQLQQIVHDSEICKHEKNSIRGTLKWLRKESIGQGLKRLSDTFLSDKEYGGIPARKFLSHCYGVRSQLVHNGCHSDKTDLNILSSQLDCLVSDLLMRKIGLDEF
ncbi:HEPN domain-containing protein [[Limnothrix rosea] IAM M-220]|uniref:HEPN domain-containing protein n=1 Tax=[Limnothrix rosea] IAM M-220 TaxID=454133 RepID=UPI000965AC18|nr:HEPN domain-containing protein [[Limnothrix rosea] IAM M-220]OKH19951.1 hypothetical protein NIES208_00280 [[Limnothrix rosea] IAM M-220]